MKWVPGRALVLLMLAVLPATVALALTVQHLLRAEARAQRAQVEAQALLTADAAAGQLVLAEGMRPPEEWQAIYHPAAVGEQGTTALPAFWRQPSPLLAGPGAWVELHVQVDYTGALSSPQVPAAAERALAAPWVNDVNLAQFTQRLQTLRAASLPWAELRAQLPAPPTAPWPQPAEDQQSSQSRQESAEPPAADAQMDQALALSEQPLRQSAAENSRRQLQKTQTEVLSAYGNRNASIQEADNDNDPSSRIARGRSVSGAMQARWLDSYLFLLRRVRLADGSEVVQGAWLDRQALWAHILPAVQEVAPGASLHPASDADDPAQVLASLPLRLELGNWQPRVAPATSRLLIALAAAVALAVVATLWLLARHALLAERRAAFVSAVTHELRSPLTALRLHADLLADERVGGDAQRRERTVHTLQSQGARLAALIDNVLDHARLERRRAPRQEAVDLAELIATHQQRWQERLSAVGLQWDAAPIPALSVRGDREALLRILDNLVDNSAKYATAAEDPRVCLQVSEAARVVLITVRDHGPGLPQGRLPRPFERSAEAAAGQAPGIGLGLSLCRRLARAMGGRLQLQDAQPGLAVTLRLRQWR